MNGPNVRILYCHCAYANVVPAATKAAVLEGLSAANVEFDAVPDLCEMAARGDARLRELAAGGVAVVVATHDAEFAAGFAARTVLLGDGRPVADAPTSEVLGGGWYFATQTARVLGAGALTPEEGAALLTAAQPAARTTAQPGVMR